jgi:hypothetical protein
MTHYVAMKAVSSGGCLCSAVRYEVTGDPIVPVLIDLTIGSSDQPDSLPPALTTEIQSACLGYNLPPTCRGTQNVFSVKKGSNHHGKRRPH